MRIAFLALALVALGGVPPGHVSWTLQAPPSAPRVISVSPTGTMTAGITQVKVVTDVDIDPVTLNSTSFSVTRAGADQILGTPDDVEVYPLSIVTAGAEITLDFKGLPLPNDQYRIRVRGTEPAIPGETNRWRLDDASGTTAQDSVGSLHGTLLGATLPAWNPAGRLGGALEFTASDHRVLLGGVDLPQPYTASMWVRRVDSPNEDARLMNSGTASFRLEQFNHTNRVGLTVPGSLDFAYTYQAPVGAWVHLAFVADGVQTALYVDGLYAQNNGGFAMNCPREYLGSSDLNSMRGLLDEVRIFSRRLTEAEIKSLAGLGGVVRGLTGLPLDGEYSGSFPSGDGVAGGDFVVDFTIAHPTPFISLASPTPGSTGPAPSQVWMASSVILDPATVGPASVRVVRAGPDTVLGTADDVVVTPTSIDLDSLVLIRINLPAGLPPDEYQVTVSGTSSEPVGAVNRWTFDEGLGTTANDSAGTDHGTLGAGRGLPVWTTGRLGTGLRFEGYSDRVLVNAAALAPPWSASAWMRRGVSTAEDGRLMDGPAGSLRTEQYNFTGKIGVTVPGVVDSAYTFAAPVGPWTHLAFLGEADGTSLYVDGAFFQKLGTALSLPRVTFGSVDYNSMVGILDEVRTYDRKLTDSEVRLLASAGGAVRSPSGELLDGEFSGTFPSGNGAAGGDFVMTFIIGPPPGAFALTAPSGGATGVSTTPTFTWTASSGATSYRIRVAEGPAGGVFGPAFVIDQSGLVATNFTPATPLAAGTAYLWDVTAFNDSGSRLAVGSISSFSTAGPPPGAFSLTAPADAATGVSTSPTFSWTASSTVTSYTLQISTDPAFGSFVVNQAGLLGTSSSPAVALSANTPYHWRVIAVNAVGTTTAGPASFTTQVAPPGAFTLSAPSAGASGVPTTPTYSWSASSGVASYTLQVSTDPGFGSFVVNQGGLLGTSSSPATTLSYNLIHHWRVLAVNAGGTTLAGPGSFTTEIAPPGAFELLQPRDHATRVLLSPTFTWEASAGTATYTLEVALDAAFSAPVISQSAIVGTSYTSAALEAGRVHYWRVTAVNSTGSTAASNGPGSFTTSPNLTVGGCGLTGGEILLLLAMLRRRRAKVRRKG